VEVVLVSDKNQVKVYLPEELHSLLNADSRSNSEAVEAALWAEYGGQKKAAIEVRLENKRTQLEAAKGTLEDERANVAELREEVSRLEAMVEKTEAQEDQYDDLLESLESELYDGANITESRGKVQEAANMKGIDTAEVILELKERNPDVPDYAFKPPRETDEDWFGRDA
jgi:DNA repair exonuclease SbcCD ATPase subunit